MPAAHSPTRHSGPVALHLGAWEPDHPVRQHSPLPCDLGPSQAGLPAPADGAGLWPQGLAWPPGGVLLPAMDKATLWPQRGGPLADGSPAPVPWAPTPFSMLTGCPRLSPHRPSPLLAWAQASRPPGPTWALRGRGALHAVAPGPVAVIVVSRGTPGGDVCGDVGARPETCPSRPRLRLSAWQHALTPIRSCVHSPHRCHRLSGGWEGPWDQEGETLPSGTHHFLWALPSDVQEWSRRPPKRKGNRQGCPSSVSTAGRRPASRGSPPASPTPHPPVQVQPPSSRKPP